MRKQSKKYEKPLKPWDKTRIEDEAKLLQNYGLRRKKEIWKTQSVLRNYRRIARSLAAKADKEKEKVLLDKLFRIGLVGKDADLDDVLALTIEKLLDRRLQTMVFKRGMCSTLKQARQYIVHGHVAVDGRKIRWPSTIIHLSDEDKISLYDRSKIKGGKV
jgi:small subunit ribosomal protein S4